MQKPRPPVALVRIKLIMSTSTALSPDVLAKYQPVIGLEVHVQLLTASKAFCGCVNQYGGEPNTHVCPTCLGLPGALPVLNRRAVEFAVLAAKAINCEIRETSIFSRKNYFYPDSPKGYQISQFDKPIAEHGWIDVPDASGRPKRIGVTRLHMEEDAGKSVHDGFADSVSKTYIDLNRCGTPLVEIVSEPDLRTADEVFEYLTQAERDSALHRRQRLQHGRGLAALRRQRQRHAQGREGVRHQGRGQKRQQLPLHPRRGGVRDRAPDRRHRRRRPRRAGVAPLEQRRRPDVLHALARSRRTTTATSPSRTSRRWSSAPSGRPRFSRICPSFPRPAAPA